MQTFANIPLLAIMIILSSLSAKAYDYVKDSEPAILEVHYTRIEITDTTKRDSHFFKDPVMLRIGKTKSMFCGTKNLWRDSLMAVDKAAYFKWDRARVMSANRDDTQLPGGHYWSYIYKNYPVKGKLTENCYFDMEDWQYEELLETPEWEISDETKDILGYQCFKATTDFRGRKWTAWFTPEIPIQDGPWKLCGLPGLILEAHDANRDYSFTADGIKQNGLGKVGYLEYRKWKGFTKVSRDQFFKNWWKYTNSDFGAKMQAAYGVGPKPSNERKAVNHDQEETNYPHDL